MGHTCHTCDACCCRTMCRCCVQHCVTLQHCVTIAYATVLTLRAILCQTGVTSAVVRHHPIWHGAWCSLASVHVGTDQQPTSQRRGVKPSRNRNTSRNVDKAPPVSMGQLTIKKPVSPPITPRPQTFTKRRAPQGKNGCRNHAVRKTTTNKQNLGITEELMTFSFCNKNP